MIDLSIIIPCYNSEKSIADIIEQISVLKEYNILYEIILINDASKDNTSFICKKMAKKFDDIIYIELIRNFGEFNAIMCGLNVCNGNYAVFVDDDGQQSLFDVICLYKKINELNCDVVYGNYINKKHPIYRNIGSSLLSFFLMIGFQNFLGLKKLSSFKIINKKTIKNIIIYKGPLPYPDSIILKQTKKISFLSVNHKERKYGVSGYNTLSLLKIFLRALFSHSIFYLIIMVIISVLSLFISTISKSFILNTSLIILSSILLILSTINLIMYIYSNNKLIRKEQFVIKLD